jgi:hypothetical protein
MVFPRSVCPAAATAAVTTGKNGVTLSSPVAAASSRCQDQLAEVEVGTENEPTKSSCRLVLAIFGSSLTASQASVSLSGAGTAAGIISSGVTMARLVRTTPGEVTRGIGKGISGTSTSGVGL